MTRTTAGPGTAVPAKQADVGEYCRQLATCAQSASRSLALVSGAARAAALRGIADLIDHRADEIVDANAKDLVAADEVGVSEAFKGKLILDTADVAKMAIAVRQIAEQVDPVGQIIEGYVLPSGIRLQKVRVPIGVLLIIFESRPNVTSDAAALCLKSGNAVILRGGKEAVHSNAAIARCVRDGLADAGLDADAVQLVETTDRVAVGELLRLEGLIDVCIPRGGESLIRAVVEQAHIPVIKHYTGNCHVYVDELCDEQMAMDICVNAKTQRPGVCNAAETLLFHKSTVDAGLMQRICVTLRDQGVEVRGDQVVQQAVDHAVAATDDDWYAEFLDLVVAVRVVDDIDQAIDHINTYGSRHTDAIVTNASASADRFVQCVDSANTFVNCSTRFSDGGEYGLGAEIGISTDKLHARGPMGAADLTTYKWVAYGNGQVRT